MSSPNSDYGLWSLVVITPSSSSVLPTASSSRRTCVTGARSFAEMYGFPLTIYLLSGWLGAKFPSVNLYGHESGHLWWLFTGQQGDPHFGVLHVASALAIFAGFTHRHEQDARPRCREGRRAGQVRRLQARQPGAGEQEPSRPREVQQASMTTLWRRHEPLAIDLVERRRTRIRVGRHFSGRRLGAAGAAVGAVPGLANTFRGCRRARRRDGAEVPAGARRACPAVVGVAPVLGLLCGARRSAWLAADDVVGRRGLSRALTLPSCQG